MRRDRQRHLRAEKTNRPSATPHAKSPRESHRIGPASSEPVVVPIKRPAPPPSNGKDVAATVAEATGKAAGNGRAYATGAGAVAPTVFPPPGADVEEDRRAALAGMPGMPYLTYSSAFFTAVKNECGWLAHAHGDPTAGVVESVKRLSAGIVFDPGLGNEAAASLHAACGMDVDTIREIIAQVAECGEYEPPGQPPPPRYISEDDDEENLPPRPRMLRCPAPEIIPSKVVINMAEALNAKPSKKGWVCLEDLELKDIEWLWPNHFVANAINIIAGMGDVGKDVFCCSIAACASSGAPWPDGSPNGGERRVGYVSPEDNPNDTIGPRLVAAGALKRNVKVWTIAEPPTVNEIAI